MWPMLAGIGPILGEGVAGYFAFPDDSVATWTFDGLVARLDGYGLGGGSVEYTLMRPNPRVAVLTDRLVASSGEAVAIAFRGRPDTRSFGYSTCGLSTGNRLIRLREGAALNLATARMADRTGHAYGGQVQPDVQLDNDDMFAAAIEWLLEGE